MAHIQITPILSNKILESYRADTKKEGIEFGDGLNKWLQANHVKYQYLEDKEMHVIYSDVDEFLTAFLLRFG